ncbi:MAG TPA: DUF4389 domain-containing protein [Gaiellaceae bacterium]|nr:DUF4389 domain-containing protein [Gaiellaceae bacterium]
MALASSQRPIRLVVRDDLRRRRLTVLLRLPLALPLLVWLVLRGIAALAASVVLWAAVLAHGQAPSALHGFLAGFVRYGTQVGAYLFLAADPYPWFRCQQGYPVDVEIDPPARQGRWSAGFRLLLALPALVLAAALGSGFSANSPGTRAGEDGGGWWSLASGGAASAAAVLTWFASLALGRAPRGLRDLVAYALGYGAQAYGYLLLLTDRYPSADPALAERYAELPAHPVRIRVEDDLGRPRLAVLFRLLLALPHLVWLALWALAALPAAVAAWAAALFTGRVPEPLHRFLAAFVRYSVHVFAFLYVVGRRFPGFTGRPRYGIDAEIDPPRRQRRWRTLVRLLLALPALLVNAALAGVLLVVGVLGWWYALVAGRMPEGLRNLGAACLRYDAQTTAYLALLTDRYPYAAPVLREREPEAAPETPPLEPLGEAA